MNKENAQDGNTEEFEQLDTLGLQQLEPTNLPGSLGKPILCKKRPASTSSSICATPTLTLVMYVAVVVLVILILARACANQGCNFGVVITVITCLPQAIVGTPSQINISN
jgi:hypothetical protein